jgi:GDP-4-dehydro-6-deoxy-D-mannose reductase
MGTLHLAHAVLRHAPNARFIWAGSSEAYGNAFNRTADPVRETAGLEPLSTYGATKAAADLMLQQLAHVGLNLIGFRPFNHTGPGQSPAFVVPAFAQQIALIEAGKRAPVVLVGNLDAQRDFLDVRDVVDAYTHAALCERPIFGQCYNLATGSPIKIGDILHTLISMCKVPVTIETDKQRFAVSAVPVASGNTAKAMDDLGWKPKIALQSTLLDVLNYQRSLAHSQEPQPNGCGTSN